MNQYKNSENNNYINFFNENQFTLNDIFCLIKRNKKIFFTTAGAIFILCIIYSVIKKPIYQGSFQIVISEQKSNGSIIEKLQRDNPLLSSFNLKGSANNSISTEIKILESPSVLKPVFNYVKKQKVENFNDKKASKMKFNSWKKSNFIIERAKGTSVLNIFYQDNIKEIILPVTKKISKEYQIYSNRSEQRSISKGIFYLNQQIMDHESKLVDAQAKAELFSVNNEISLVPTEENRKILITDIELLNSNASNKIKDFSLKLKLLKQAEDSNNNSENILFIAKELPYFNKNVELIKQVNINLNKLRLNFQEKDPKIIKLKSEKKYLIDELKNQLKIFISAQIQKNQLILSSTEKQAETIIKYKTLLRDVQRYELILNQLSAKLQQLSLKKAEESEPWELISNPTVLEQPIAPNRKLIVLMGFLASIFFGYTLSLINEKRTGLIFSLDEFKSNIKYPFLKKLILSRKNECKEFLSIYKKSLKKRKIDSIGLINLGDPKSKLNAEFAKIFKEIFKDNNIIISNDLTKTNECSALLLVMVEGENTFEELNRLTENLTFQDSSVLGWFYIKD